MTIADLDILIGSWKITGRTANADHDDINGDVTVMSLLNGQVLQLGGSMRVGGSEIQSLELIWHDETTGDFAAHVYSGAGAPLNYRWSRNGDTLTHSGLGMTYTGTISTDRNTITGAWRADPDRPDMAGSAYDAAMRRTNQPSGPASSFTGIETERVTASTTIEAAPEAVFAVLADPSAHADIDGTGWVRESLDGDRICAAGQVFRMAMYHENHPDEDYTIANRVEVFDEPRAIAWQPGTESPETGELSFGGWIWRYDLAATGPSRTTVTLTYDWSAVPPQVREYLQFPPFGQDHLDNSLQHLSDLVARTTAP